MLNNLNVIKIFVLLFFPQEFREGQNLYIYIYIYIYICRIYCIYISIHGTNILILGKFHFALFIQVLMAR